MTTDFVKWIKENDLEMPSVSKQDSNLIGIDNEALYEWRKVIGELSNLLNKPINKNVKGLDFYNSINEYKIRIKKLQLIAELKTYKAYNIKKETKVKYIVIRAFWVDSNGKPFRNFSKNLGAEYKVKTNEKNLTINAQQTIQMQMWDLYQHEYEQTK
jgi:hypothetical protein